MANPPSQIGQTSNEQATSPEQTGKERRRREEEEEARRRRQAFEDQKLRAQMQRMQDRNRAVAEQAQAKAAREQAARDDLAKATKARIDAGKQQVMAAQRQRMIVDGTRWIRDVVPGPSLK